MRNGIRIGRISGERSNVRQAPVIQDGRLVGLLRRRDITRRLQTQSEFVTS
jgi:CBS domain-containing protein